MYDNWSPSNPDGFFVPWTQEQEQDLAKFVASCSVRQYDETGHLIVDGVSLNSNELLAQLCSILGIGS